MDRLAKIKRFAQQHGFEAAIVGSQVRIDIPYTQRTEDGIVMGTDSHFVSTDAETLRLLGY